VKRWKSGLVALLALGLAWSLGAGPAQAGARAGEKPARAPEKKPVKAAQPAERQAPATATRAKAAPLNVKIRSAAVAAVPPPPPREPVLLPVAMEEDLAPARPTKVVPMRAYARDGASFYQNGQLILVQGLADAGGEHAKQRLQQLLDGGQVSVLPVGGASGDGMLAVVRVNGRDVAEAMASD
jgi:hypothetical protein